MWESVPEGGPEEGWAELDENGWGVLIGWAAGPENLRRGPLADDSTRTVTVTCLGRDGSVTAAVYAKAPQPTHPAEIAPVMKQSVQRLYSSQGQAGPLQSSDP